MIHFSIQQMPKSFTFSLVFLHFGNRLINLIFKKKFWSLKMHKIELIINCASWLENIKSFLYFFFEINKKNSDNMLIIQIMNMRLDIILTISISPCIEKRRDCAMINIFNKF